MHDHNRITAQPLPSRPRNGASDARVPAHHSVKPPLPTEVTPGAETELAASRRQRLLQRGIGFRCIWSRGQDAPPGPNGWAPPARGATRSVSEGPARTLCSRPAWALTSHRLKAPADRSAWPRSPCVTSSADEATSRYVLLDARQSIGQWSVSQADNAVMNFSGCSIRKKWLQPSNITVSELRIPVESHSVQVGEQIGS